jgi:hypothetical protein
MKQILKLVFLLVLGQTALAQAPSNYTNINGRYRWIAGMFDSTFHIPKGATPSLRTGGSTNAGGLFYNTADSSVYTYTGTQWIKVRGSLNPSDTTNKYVTQVYKKNASDSVFYVKGGNHTWAFNDSTGSPGGGGGGKIYYFNGGVSMGTISGLQMYELGDTANTGAAANFTRSTTGNIANFITDPGKPGLVQIPAGVWSVDAWLSETGGGANHAEIWIEVEKWDGSTITTIATSPIEQITEGATPNLYSWSVTIPTTTLAITDRIIIQFYISNTNGKTVTLYTQNGYVGEVHTTFTTGIGAINGLTTPAQYLVTGTSGTDFNINSATATHTFNLPTASATNRGALSTTDWSTFNSKIGPSDTASMLSPYLRKADTTAMLNPYFRLAGVGLKNTGQTVYADTLLLSTRAWRQKGIDSVQSNITSGLALKVNISDTATMLANYINSVGYGLSKAGQVVSADSATLASYFLRRKDSLTATNLLGYVTRKILADTAAAIRTAGGGVSGSGTTNYIPKFTSSSAIGNSVIYDQSGLIGINTTTPGSYNANAYNLVVGGTSDAGITIFGNSAEGSSNLYLADGTTGDQAYRGFLRYTHSNDALTIGTSGITRMTLDASGNLGLGLTPNTWPAGQIAFEFGSLGTLVSTGSTVSLQNNSYNNGTNNIRKVIGEASSYSQSGGAHIWQYAASGASGSTISFSEAMRITSGGNVLVGGTSDNGSRLQVTGAATFSSSVTASGGFEIPNGQFYRARRSSGSLLTDMIGIPSGTDDVRILTTGDFNIVNGSLSNILTVKNGGNVGIGVTPSAWAVKAIDISTTGAVFGDGIAFDYSAGISQNCYRSGNTTWNYKLTGVGTSRFELFNNTFSWYVAPTGTAGNAISFTQAMTLDASGNLMVGGTSVFLNSRVSIYQNSTNRTLSLVASTAKTNTTENPLFSLNSSETSTPQSLDITYKGNASIGSRYFAFQTSETGVAYGGNILFQPNGGNVGIGTSAPSYKFDVQVASNKHWAIAASSTGEASFRAGNDGYAAFAIGEIDASTLRLNSQSGGEVLINTTTDAGNFKLQVNGAIYATNGTSENIWMNDGVSSSSLQQASNVFFINSNASSATQGSIIFRSSSAYTERMRITNAGEVYIAGTTDQGAYNLQVNGTGVWGAGAYFNGSDIRLKENIKEVESALSLVNQLKPKTYTYKESYSSDRAIQIGFIAQDLEQVLKDQDYKNSIVVEGKEYKSVAYQNLIPLLVKAIQEQQIEIENLKKQIK